VKASTDQTRATVSSEGISEILSNLAEALGFPLFVVDTCTRRFLLVNHVAASLLGYSESELLSLAADRVIHPLLDVYAQVGQGHGEVSVGVNLISKSGVSTPCRLDCRLPPHPGHILLILGQLRSSGSTPCSLHANSKRTERHDREDLIETTLEFPSIVGQSDEIRGVCRLIGLVAKTDTTVLIQGESGTGKELVGQAIHFHSHRGRGPFVKVNCAALTETLLESELFGHKKGAFTGAIQDRKGRFMLADGGTIILDEIGNMPLSGQAKLLRVLQEKEFEPVGESVTVRVNVRVVAITNVDLPKAIDQGKFREDLYYRLNAFPIRLPPLRERKVDIPLLARHFLRQYTISLKKQIEDLEPDSVSQLMHFSWPGNVRELENAIEYAVILEKSNRLQPSSLPEKLASNQCSDSSLSCRLRLAEREIILEALSKSNGVKSRAAKVLGIDRRNFNYFLNKHGLNSRCEQ